MLEFAAGTLGGKYAETTEVPVAGAAPPGTLFDYALTIGLEVVLHVSIPCPRCVMTTLPRVDLPLDPRILRTVAQLNKLNLGDFGDLPCMGV